MAQENSYNKRPLWQWILLYVVIAAVLYGLFYYFVLAKKTSYSPPSDMKMTTNESSQAPATGNTVTIKDMAFSVSSLKVKVGDTVTWRNDDQVGHSATADDGSFDTGVLANGQTGSVTFSKAGTYSYYCSVHPNMKATIVVE